MSPLSVRDSRPLTRAQEELYEHATRPRRTICDVVAEFRSARGRRLSATLPYSRCLVFVCLQMQVVRTDELASECFGEGCSQCSFSTS